MSRDNGHIFKDTFRVNPGEDGSFVVRLDGYERPGDMPTFWAFSTVDDLIDWLTHNAEAFKSGGPQAGDGKS